MNRLMRLAEEVLRNAISVSNELSKCVEEAEKNSKNLGSVWNEYDWFFDALPDDLLNSVEDKDNPTAAAIVLNKLLVAYQENESLRHTVEIERANTVCIEGAYQSLCTSIMNLIPEDIWEIYAEDDLSTTEILPKAIRGIVQRMDMYYKEVVQLRSEKFLAENF